MLTACSDSWSSSISGSAESAHLLHSPEDRFDAPAKDDANGILGCGGDVVRYGIDQRRGALWQTSRLRSNLRRVAGISMCSTLWLGERLVGAKCSYGIGRIAE